jgi:HlyD family secretion protein
MGVVGKRALLWGAIGALLTVLLTIAFLPRALRVEVRTLAPGPFRATLEAEGVTRVRNVFTMSAPVAGRVLRNPLEVGDELVQGDTVVATIEPSDPAFLDPRTLAESQHDLEAAEAERDLAAAEVARAEGDLTFAAAERARAEELFAHGSVPRRFVDEAQRESGRAEAALAAARAALDVREHHVMRARARLGTPVRVARAGPDCDCIELKAPVDGRVLQIFEKSEAVVQAGAPLLEIGNPAELEVVADFLSADAVQIAAGQRAEISGWGGTGVLPARVRRVEPFGFTKVSALGIEEQRVNVVLDLTAPAAEWRGLGHGYRVMVGVIAWESESALTVPVTALFRNAGAWQVFVVSDGVARVREVEVGARAALETLVTGGLAPGDVVIVNPPEKLADGARVAARSDLRPHAPFDP